MQKRPLWLIGFTMYYDAISNRMADSGCYSYRIDLKAQISLSVSIEVIVSLLIVTFFTFGIRALILKRMHGRYAIL